MEIKYKINSRILLLSVLGAIMACTSYLMFVYNPVQMIVKKFATLSPGSIFLNLWSAPPFDVVINCYIFNVTNAQQFLDGTEKLNLSQIGPYAYKEILTNTNATFNENGTITFAPRRALVFMRELSVGDPDVDRILSPNIPLIGITASLQEASMFTNLAVASISNFLGSKPFVNITISEYLWGYDDRLVTLANKAIPTWINFDRFGIMDRLMALDNASNIVTINTSPDRVEASPELTDEERHQMYHIHRWNGSPGLKQWGYVDAEGNETLSTNNRCNMVEGTFEGTIFPTYIKENSTFKLYRRAFCRPVPMKYESQGYSKDGFLGYNYRVDQLFLAKPEENPENACFCPKGKCPMKGLGSLSPCYYDIPIVISQPHFLNSDPELLEHVNGMEPNKTEHDTVLMLNPQMGIPLSANLRIQINLDVGETKYNSRTRPFNGMVLPLFWLEMYILDIPTTVYLIIMFLTQILPFLQQLLMYSLGIAGLGLISGSALVSLFYTKEEQNGRLSFKSEYSAIPIIPISTQYFNPDIRICK